MSKVCYYDVAPLKPLSKTETALPTNETAWKSDILEKLSSPDKVHHFPRE